MTRTRRDTLTIDHREEAERHGSLWTIIAVIEVAMAAVVIVGDVFIPTLVILTLAVVSLAIRRDGLANLGLTRSRHPGRMALQILALTIGWTLVQLAVVLPVMNHITGDHQDQGQIGEIQGDLTKLLVYLALSWTLAAFGEELVYRGYLPVRIVDALGGGQVALFAAIVTSSVLFGLAHTEQGLVGVMSTILDALFWSYLRWRYATLWAPVLAHGFNNTIGLIAVFLVGPTYGLW